MTILAEFLQSNEEKLRQEEVERQARREEWVRRLDRLLTQIEGWLQQADPKGLMHIERTTHECREQGLGYYHAPGLSIILGSARAGVIPIARNVAGRINHAGSGNGVRPDGLVYLDGAYQYHLYRIIGASGDQWFLSPSVSKNPQPLGREEFERALLELIR